MGTGDWIFIGVVCVTPIPLLSLLVQELCRTCRRHVLAGNQNGDLRL